MSTLDARKNFGIANVDGGYNASDLEVSVVAGEGNRFPDTDTHGQYNLVWWNRSEYSTPAEDPGREIVRVTSHASGSDVFTIVRAQEGTSATVKNLSGRTYALELGATSKMFDDIESAIDGKVPVSEKGAANGVASLDGTGKVPALQLPSYVDDVVEYADYASLPATGETGKIYITTDNGKVYRWAGTVYAEITPAGTTWGTLIGNILDQLDLILLLDTKLEKDGSNANSDVRIGEMFAFIGKAMRIIGVDGAGIIELAKQGHPGESADPANYGIMYIGEDGHITFRSTYDPLSPTGSFRFDASQLSGDKKFLLQDVSGTIALVADVQSLADVVNVMATAMVPYLGAISDVDLGTNSISSRTVYVTGTSGNGSAQLRHQDSDAWQNSGYTAFFADINGNIAWKKSGGFYCRLDTSLFNADRNFTMPNVSGKLVTENMAMRAAFLFG